MQYSLSLIKELEKQFGLPLYVFSEREFRDNYLDFLNFFQSVYPNYRVSYSYKTNYTPYICSLVKELGGYAEVVSGMEYYIAKKIGYESGKIIFNGPNKDNDDLNAILEGSIVNVDSIYELKKVINLAEKYPNKKLKIGLRVNMNVGQNFISRFGMDRADIENSFNMVKRILNLKIVGIHCHISRCRNLDAWKKRTQIMLDLADKYFPNAPEYIDLGSGMFGKMAPEFAKQFDNIPTYEEYASVTAKLVDEHYKDLPEPQKPILFTEPGTTLINRYIDFIGRVDSIKQIGGKYFSVLNCGEHNLGETCMLKQLPIKVFNTDESAKQYKNMDFTGYTCLEQDVMYRNFDGKIAVGDYIVFGNTGGYSNVYKPPFIKPNCAMVAIDSNDHAILMKRAENYDDILHTYVF